MSELSGDKRCKRNDGRGWRCKLPVVEGKAYCERHLTQGILRQKRQPVPDHLKFERARRSIAPKVEPQELEQGSNEGKITDLPLTRTRTVGNNRMRKEEEASDVVVVDDVPISKRVAKEPKFPDVLGAFDPDIFGCGSTSVPESPVKRLPSIKQIVKATAKKKINNKCHWCRLSSYRVLVKCSTCKRQFFCKECIDKRFHCKNTIMRECPVCLGECTCQACTKGTPKNVKTKEPVIHDVDEDVIISDPEKEMNVCNRENELDKSQRLHIIGELLPVIEQMHQEIMMELDTEAKLKGKSHDQIKVQFPKYPQKKECSFCKACIADVHRSCDYCGYIFCLSCCEEYRSGYLHTRLENLKTTRCVRSKKSINISWNLGSDGSIICPPKKVGGCDKGLLNLTSFSPLGFAKLLEEAAKHIMVHDYKFKKAAFSLSTSSPCPLCDENNILGLKFSTKKEFMDMNLEHFMSHWGKGQPVVIPNVVLKPDLNWDFGFILCEYLKKGAKSRNDIGICDWFEVNLGRKQIISRGTRYENIWKEFIKFKLRLSGVFLQDHFPSYYDAVMQSLPIQEYINPFSGSLNLAANMRDEAKNSNLGFYVNIFYGGLEDPTDADLVSNLCFHAHDVVNVLVNATAHSFPEKVLNEVKVLMNEYNSQDHLRSSKKIANRNIVEEMTASSAVLVSDEKSDEESEDEDLSQAFSKCGAKWDIYCREDVPKLVEYLTKYSDMLISTPYGSPKKVVHPLFDQIFYLSDFEKMRLKEEYDVEAWSFEQHIGETVIIPAGCPYQMKKIKSCVNVVVEFISPESALECIKVSDEIRLLPVNHQAKGNMVQVKKMVINRMQATVEEVNA